ncbi:MAG: hypothetical protein ABIH39_08355 [Candidatus Margulisiibacteriota bacterium]
MNRFIIFLLTLMVLSIQLSADDYTAAFIENGFTADTVSMGNAVLTRTKSAQGWFYNPAAILAGESRGGITSSYCKLFGLVEMYYMGYGQEFDTWGWGVGYGSVGLGGITGATRVDNRNVETGQTYSYNGSVLAISISQLLDKTDDYYIGYGMTARLIRQELVDSECKDWGVDVGALYSSQILKAAIKVENLGRPLLVWDTPSRRAEVVLPRLACGIGWEVVENMDWALDIYIREHENMKYRTGFEYIMGYLLDQMDRKNDIFTLRWGVDNGRFTLGCGLAHHALRIDYAFIHPSVDYMEMTHIISLSYDWREEKSQVKFPVKKTIEATNVKPEITELSLPDKVLVVNTYKLPVRGQSIRTNKFYINGREVELDRFARFYEIMSLNVGTNVFRFRAITVLGEELVVERTVIYKPE